LADRTIQYSNSKRPATYCRNVGRRRRWEFAIHDHEDEKEILSDKYIWNFLKPWLQPYEVELERKTIYTFQSAIAMKWRSGRIFLAGDAAHLMPPFMGQGMCAGIRDASNLSWKIAYCLKNNHSDKLLSTCQSERYSNVKEYIKTTARMGEFVNAVGTSNITGKVSSTPDGQKSMKSIKPKLGKGLGKVQDKNRGKIFPQFKIKNGKSLDVIFNLF
jgi:3-(3-hydroxy-phenyl)propionate hydroxylase